MSRGHEPVAICHSGNGEHYALIEPDNDGVLNGHEHHEYDYPAMDFGTGAFCADNPVPPTPTTTGPTTVTTQLCPTGDGFVNWPAALPGPEVTPSTTPSTTAPTTTTTTSHSSPVESTPTAPGETATPASSSTTPASTTLLSQPKPIQLTELPHTGGVQGVALGIALICAGIALRCSVRSVRG